MRRSAERDAHTSEDVAGCPTCGRTETEVGSIAATGDGLSKLFDLQTNSFRVVSCTNCGYSERYRDTSSRASDVVDVFLE